MYKRQLFEVAFLVGVIFCESNGSAGFDDLHNEITILFERIFQQHRQRQLEWERKKTPLTLAADRGNIELVQSLLAGKADVNQKDKEGRTALMQAASRACPAKPVYQAMVQCLLDAKVDVNQVDRKHKTALMLSLRPEIEPYGFMPGGRERYEYDVEVVRLLLAARADVTIQDDAWCTVLELIPWDIIFYDRLIDLLAEACDGSDDVSRRRWLVQVKNVRDGHNKLRSRFKVLDY